MGLMQEVVSLGSSDVHNTKTCCGFFRTGFRCDKEVFRVTLRIITAGPDFRVAVGPIPVFYAAAYDVRGLVYDTWAAIAESL
jgi:hypothetical protein